MQFYSIIFLDFKTQAKATSGIDEKMSNSGSNSSKVPAGGEKKSGGEDGERAAQPPMCFTSDEVNYLIFRYDSLKNYHPEFPMLLTRCGMTRLTGSLCFYLWI